MNKLTTSIITIIIASIAIPAMAQDDAYKWDIGAGGGMSGYLGEANSANLFQHPGYSAAISMRYLFNPRWAVRGQLSTMSLSGNSADMENVFPGAKTYKFSSQVYDLGFRGEANFFNYGIGETYKKLRRWTPFAAIGLGATLSATGGSTFFAMNIPMSLGIKYKLKPRLNLALEFTMTKVFGDHVDSKELSDIYTIKSSFAKNTDWYSSIMFSISYEFGKRCVTCYYVD